MPIDHIPSTHEILKSGICDGDSDTQEFFHCTPAKNLKSILRTGLVPGNGKTFDTEGHSTGRIFVAIGHEEAVSWQEMIAEVTMEKVAILLLRLTKKQIQSLRTDDLAYAEGNFCSTFLTVPVKASQIVVDDDGRGSLDHVQMSEAATKNDVYGRYLFGQERSLPKKNPEPNTGAEDDFLVALSQHYHGEMEELNPYIDQMAELEDEGKYTDILRVPPKYKYAYRVMGVSAQQLIDILGGDPEPVTRGKMVHATKGTFWHGAGNRKHYSWTVRPSAFKEILQDWGILNMNRSDYLVFLRAPIKNGNRFLLNPDSEILRDTSSEYAYQDEVISVGDVKCDGVWYVETTAHREGGFRTKRSPYGLEQRTTRQMVGHDRELRSLKETLDYLTDERLDESFVNTALDVAGLIPGIGEGADLVNAGLYAAKKEYLLAALSLVSAIPAIGDIVGKGGKLVLWIEKTFPKAAAKVAKHGPDIVRGIEVLKSALLKNKGLIEKLFDAVKSESNNSPAAQKLIPHLPKMISALDIFTKTAKTGPDATAPTLTEIFGGKD